MFYAINVIEGLDFAFTTSQTREAVWGACHKSKVPGWAGFTCTIGETEAAAEPKELIFKLWILVGNWENVKWIKIIGEKQKLIIIIPYTLAASLWL